jgi:hypothetical protein
VYRYLYLQATGTEIIESEEFKNFTDQILIHARFEKGYNNANNSYVFGIDYLVKLPSQYSMLFILAHETEHNLFIPANNYLVEDAIAEMLADNGGFAVMQFLDNQDKMPQIQNEMKYADRAWKMARNSTVQECHDAGRTQLFWIENTIKDKTGKPVDWPRLLMIGIQMNHSLGDVKPAIGDFAMHLVARYLEKKVPDVEIHDNNLARPEDLDKISYNEIINRARQAADAPVGAAIIAFGFVVLIIPKGNKRSEMLQYEVSEDMKNTINLSTNAAYLSAS